MSGTRSLRNYMDLMLASVFPHNLSLLYSLFYIPSHINVSSFTKPLIPAEILLSQLKIRTYSNRLRKHASLHAQKQLRFLWDYFFSALFPPSTTIIPMELPPDKNEAEIPNSDNSNRPIFYPETKVICLSQNTSPIINSHWPQFCNLPWVPNFYESH